MGYDRKRRYEYIILFLSLVTCVASAETGQKTVICEYNRTKALVLVEYASAVYIVDNTSLLSWTCSRCKGLTKDFKIHTLVVDPHCLQAFVGVAENLKSIVIAFRGTQDTSMQNWAEDLYFRELDLNYPGFSDAMVHSGFYAAYHNTTLREQVVDAVQAILEARSDLSIMITGHSMGGAMATFCGLDLSANYGLKNVEVVTFGQPRVGNYAFAMYYSEHVPLTIRVTHANDIVPHLPPNYPWLGEKTYHHFATEVWIFRVAIGRLQYEFERVCDSSGEDTSCSRAAYLIPIRRIWDGVVKLLRSINVFDDALQNDLVMQYGFYCPLCYPWTRCKFVKKVAKAPASKDEVLKYGHFRILVKAPSTRA